VFDAGVRKFSSITLQYIVDFDLHIRFDKS